VFEAEKKHPGFGAQVMGYHVREQIPVLWGLADNFTLCDRWFASVMGPTWPNRFYLHACSSNGQKENFPEPFLETLWHRCDDAGIVQPLLLHRRAVGRGRVPAGADGVGQARRQRRRLQPQRHPEPELARPVLQRLRDRGPAELRDHRPRLHLERRPPVAQHPARADPHRLDLQGARREPGLAKDPAGHHLRRARRLLRPRPAARDRRRGPRVQAARLPRAEPGDRPTVRRGCVNSTQFEHSSVGATLMRRFGLVPLNERMATAPDLSSCINPDFIDDPQPAPQVPQDRRVGLRASSPTSATRPARRSCTSPAGTPVDEAHRQRVRAATLALLKRAEKLGVARLRP
jgi:phospholipase C